MKSIVFATIFSAMQLASCGAWVREPEGGLFGIKFGSKPEVMRELMKIESLDARLVLVAPEDENAPDCLAILDREGKVVQVKFLMPGPVEKSRQAVLKEWKPQYGEPTISGSFEFYSGGQVKYDTFIVGDTALCCEVDGEVVSAESTDIAAMTHLLAQAVRPRERSQSPHDDDDRRDLRRGLPRRSQSERGRPVRLVPPPLRK